MFQSRITPAYTVPFEWGDVKTFLTWTHVGPRYADLANSQPLPPYDTLDQILERLVEREESVAGIVAAGFDRETVLKVERMLTIAEYKRRQAAPGVKVTLKNFGRDRRYPITNRFRDPGTVPSASDRTPVKGPTAAKADAGDF